MILYNHSPSNVAARIKASYYTSETGWFSTLLFFPQKIYEELLTLPDDLPPKQLNSILLSNKVWAFLPRCSFCDDASLHLAARTTSDHKALICLPCAENTSKLFAGKALL